VCNNSDTCVSCGKLNERCCAAELCTAAGTVCAPPATGNGADVCRTCGGDGQPCCAGNTCTGAGLTCDRDTDTCG
jgi:hypothetical protein